MGEDVAFIDPDRAAEDGKVFRLVDVHNSVWTIGSVFRRGGNQEGDATEIECPAIYLESNGDGGAELVSAATWCDFHALGGEIIAIFAGPSIVEVGTIEGCAVETTDSCA